MKTTTIAVALLTCFVWAACSQNPAAPIRRELTTLEKRLVQSDNEFGLKLFSAINTAEGSKNIFISPLSVSMALGMTMNGAAGDTRNAMEQTLEFEAMTEQEINQTYRSLIDLLIQLDPKVEFRIANSIWHDQALNFEQPFLEVNRQYFDAAVEGLDFADPNSVEIINNWVAQNTNGKINRIVDEIDPDTIMYLINAIYFKAGWTQKFDADLTEDDVFRLENGGTAPVKMMKLFKEMFYFENDQLQAVELAYGDSAFSMTLLLPKEGISVEATAQLLTDDNWAEWTNSLAVETVDLSMPKFKLEYEIGLKDVLSTMGMSIAFDPGQADFSRLYSARDDVHISKVKHKTFVEVNEEGTEAAAVTSVEVSVTSAPRTIPMRLDRPFLFVIRDSQSGTILFIGKLVEPTA